MSCLPMAAIHDGNIYKSLTLIAGPSGIWLKLAMLTVTVSAGKMRICGHRFLSEELSGCVNLPNVSCETTQILLCDLPSIFVYSCLPLPFSFFLSFFLFCSLSIFFFSLITELSSAYCLDQL